MNSFVIVGDKKNYNDCLVCVCYGDRKHAEQTLQCLIKNPSESDKRMIKGYSNLRVKEVTKQNCWWNKGCD